MRIFVALGASAAAFGAATAQVGEDNPVPAIVEPQLHEPEIDRGLAPASELDALSQGTNQDFPAFDTREKRKGVSVTIRALNKITARYTDIEAKIDESAKFASLEILPRACDKRPPEDFPETTAFLEVFDRDLARARGAASVEARDLKRRKDGAVVVPVATEATQPSATAEASGAVAKPVDPDRIFSGWMFASSPGLNPLEHPVYDVWVIDCKTVVADE